MQFGCRGLFQIRHDWISAVSQHILGVAGFAAASDYSYFTAMAEYFIVAGLQLRVRHEQPPSATFLHLLGAAGIAAIADYFVANTTDYNLNS
jgi:hypothetical protein